MADFKIAYAVTMGHEGGYANDPVDTGGETYKGVSRNNFPNWNGWTIIDLIKKVHGKTAAIINKHAAANRELQTMVETFYKRSFWDVNKLDGVVSQQIANELFDTGVNMGVGIAAKFLQEAINICNRNETLYKDIDNDGIIGNQTLITLNTKASANAILNTLNLLQGERYLNIMRKNKTQRKFWPSWLSRTIVTGKW